MICKKIEYLNNWLPGNRSNLFLIVILFFFYCKNSFAQKDEVTMLDPLTTIEIPNNFKDYSFTPIGNKGALLIAHIQPNEATFSPSYWQITKYNTDLVLENSIKVNLNGTYCKIKDSFTNDKFAYLLFEKCRNPYLKENQYMLYKLDLVTFKDSIIPFTLVKNTIKEKVTSLQFYPFGKSIVLYGSIYPKNIFKGFDFVQISNLDSKISNLIKFDETNFNFKKSDINLFFQIPDKKEFILIIAATEAAKKSTSNIYSMHINYEGKVLSKTNLTDQISEIEGKITNSQVNQIDKNKLMYVATYVSSRSTIKKVSNFMTFTEEGNAEGISITLTDKGETINSKKIEFSDLKCLSTDKIFNVDGSRTKNKEKESVFRTLLRPHKILKIGANFLYVGEILQPIYTTNSKGGSSVTGYSHTKALLICFDKSGNLIWDRTVPLYMNVNSVYNNKKVVSMYFSQDKEQVIILAHHNGRHKEYLISPAGKIESYKGGVAISKSEQKIIKSFKSDLFLWYQKFYFTSGPSVIKDKSNNRKREVIFVNKYKISVADY